MIRKKVAIDSVEHYFQVNVFTVDEPIVWRGTWGFKMIDSVLRIFFTLHFGHPKYCPYSRLI